MTKTIDAWREQIEPIAADFAKAEFAVAASQAISAKRQADALERIAESLARLACCEYEDRNGDHYFRVNQEG